MAATFAVPMEVRRATAPPVRRSRIVSMQSKAQKTLWMSPDVAHAVSEACAGDERSIAEIAARLSPQQRQGLRALPDPLPMVPSIAALGSSFALNAWERDALLLAAICIDDRIDVLLEATGRSMTEVLGGALSTQLALVASRFSFADPRARIWVHEGATISERTRAHERLAVVYAGIGDTHRTLWHRALSAVQGDSSLSASLLRLSADATRRAQVTLAYAAAREAASHADACDLDRARAVAGSCALAGGWLDDALDWLGPVIDGDDAQAVSDALPGFVVAATVRNGAVPTADLRQQRPQEAEDPRWLGYARAALLAAAFSAERAQPAESASWFAEAKEAATHIDRPVRLTAVATAWSALFSDSRDEVEASTWPLCAALRHGLDGDCGAGLRLLAGSERLSRCADEGPIAGGERSRFIRAHRAVAEALLRMWSGDLRASLRGLEHAARELPVVLPFGGIAVSLARRLELAVDGRLGPLSTALDAACPISPPGDRLIDRGIDAYLTGDSEQAGVHVRLWAECGGLGPVFALPGLDEVGPIDSAGGPIAPPDALRSRALLHRIRSARESAWENDYQDVADSSRQIVSPFERARVEALLGTAYATRGDRAVGIRHLRAARTLFTDAGATAWARSVEARIAKLGPGPEGSSLPTTAPIPVPDDPLWVCRMAWEPLLTDRELAVAMLVADGRTNREVAERLFVSVRTVEVHIGRMFTKLDVRSRGELIALAHRTNQLI